MLICLSMIESEHEQSKLEAIYHTYGGLMFAVAMQILHQQEDAEGARGHGWPPSPPF